MESERYGDSIDMIFGVLGVDWRMDGERVRDGVVMEDESNKGKLGKVQGGGGRELCVRSEGVPGGEA